MIQQCVWGIYSECQVVVLLNCKMRCELYCALSLAFATRDWTRVFPTSLFCWSSRNRSGVRTAPGTAAAGSSDRCCTDAFLPACWPGFSSGSPACCLPEKTEGTVPVQPLLLFPSEHVTCLNETEHWVKKRGGKRKAKTAWAISNKCALVNKPNA